MRQKLIIEGNAVYEVDENCLKSKSGQNQRPAGGMNSGNSTGRNLNIKRGRS